MPPLQARQLLLPGDPGFYQILATPPPEPDNKNFVVRAGESVQVAVDARDLDEYLEGGEYDERLTEIEDDIESDILYLPVSVSYSR